ncbi:(d)CMP kinase [Demequina oxidasica]|uniref:(d)CMP kinase n=1 Tax=Demequina oxidasica TaxID=676199 RepID=UPI000784F49D|nr:(d)CMP kinase [Demequina oxidasica]
MQNPSIAALADEVRRRDPHLATTRLLLIDGPAGSGKTTLAGRLGKALDAQVVHGDDIYEGWSGLDTMWPTLGEQILEPLARGEEASFAAWDWHASRRGAVIDVPATPFLIIEGVGVAQRAARPFASLVLYVEAPWSERLRRGIQRDGEAMRDDWERWQVLELIHHDVQQTRAGSHIEIDGTAPIPDA